LAATVQDLMAADMWATAANRAAVGEGEIVQVEAVLTTPPVESSLLTVMEAARELPEV
jgi:hypothetical protein